MNVNKLAIVYEKSSPLSELLRGELSKSNKQTTSLILVMCSWMVGRVHTSLLYMVSRTEEQLSSLCDNQTQGLSCVIVV